LQNILFGLLSSLLTHKTSLALPLFIEVPVPCQVMYMC